MTRAKLTENIAKPDKMEGMANFRTEGKTRAGEIVQISGSAKEISIRFHCGVNNRELAEGQGYHFLRSFWAQSHPGAQRCREYRSECNKRSMLK